MLSYTCTCPHEQWFAPGGSGAWQGGHRSLAGGGVPTWHVHHPAVAALKHGLLFTAQPAGRHTVGRVALKLRLPEPALRPAVAPGLGQIGQLQRRGMMGSRPAVPPCPPVPSAPAKSMRGLTGCEFREGRSGQHALSESKGPAPCPTQAPACVTVMEPSPGPPLDVRPPASSVTCAAAQNQLTSSKRPDSKYFRLCEPHRISHAYYYLIFFYHPSKIQKNIA